MEGFAVFGNIIWSSGPDRSELRPGHYAVCEDGLCSGVFRELPSRFDGIRTDDFGDLLIFPGYTDLHLHASQYMNMGLGMDSELLDWLERYTFPQEAAFAREDYARRVYGLFAEELRSGFTTRACVFSTVHVPATLILSDMLERTGLRCMVGKVNMDRNCPDNIREKDAASSLKDTENWLALAEGRYENVSPIISPRFVPSCSGELLRGLGKTARARSLPVQSHLSENPAELEWVAGLHPECGCYGEVYEKFGLTGPRTVMAHCVYLTERDRELIKTGGTFIAHCPTSNSNLGSGIAPAAACLADGMNIGLGSDISGGHTTDMAEVIREAIRVSKLLRRQKPEGPKALGCEEAFFMATRGGGAFFGKAGAFEPGFEFDAVVADDTAAGDYTPRERFEKFIHTASSRNIRAKYVRGRRLF